jgi:hypothetical protein
MKTDYVKKGLAIGVIVLFVCAGLSSALAIKGINQNNNDIINSNIIGTAENLPDLTIYRIYRTLEIDNYPPIDDYHTTRICIQNIGNASFHGNVIIDILIYSYRGTELFSTLIGSYRYFQRIDLAPEDGGKELVYIHPEPDVYHVYSCRFFKIVAYVNYDGNVKESNYSNNAARQKFWRFLAYWIEIGHVSYPLLVPHQLGI